MARKLKVPDSKHSISSRTVAGIYCWMTVRGEPLRVYGVHKDGAKTVGYVQAEAGKAFEVHHADMRTKQPHSSYMTAVYVDTKDAESLITNKHDIGPQPLSDPFRYAIAKGSSVRPFAFPAPPSTSKASGSIQGTVQLRYWRVRNIKPSQKPWSSPFEHHHQGKGKEKDDGSPSIETDRVKGSEFEYVDREFSPKMILELRYRDEAFLRRNGYLQDEAATTQAKAPSKSSKRVAAPHPPPSGRTSRSTGLPTPSATPVPPSPARKTRPQLSTTPSPEERPKIQVKVKVVPNPVVAANGSKESTSPSLAAFAPALELQPTAVQSSTPTPPVASTSRPRPAQNAPSPSTPSTFSQTASSSAAVQKGTTATATTSAKKTADSRGTFSKTNLSGVSKKRRLAAAKKELESLKRQERIAQLELEIEALEEEGEEEGGEVGEEPKGKRVKAE